MRTGQEGYNMGVVINVDKPGKNCGPSENLRIPRALGAVKSWGDVVGMLTMAAGGNSSALVAGLV